MNKTQIETNIESLFILECEKKDFLQQLKTKNYQYMLYPKILKFKNDEDVALAVIGKDSFFFRYFSKKIRDNKKIVCKAVARDPFLLQFVSARLRNDPDVLRIAGNAYLDSMESCCE